MVELYALEIAENRRRLLATPIIDLAPVEVAQQLELMERLVGYICFAIPNLKPHMTEASEKDATEIVQSWVTDAEGITEVAFRKLGLDFSPITAPDPDAPPQRPENMTPSSATRGSH